METLTLEERLENSDDGFKFRSMAIQLDHYNNFHLKEYL